MSAVALLRPLPGLAWVDGPDDKPVGCVILALGATDGGGAGWAAVVTVTGELALIGMDGVEIQDESIQSLAEAAARAYAQGSAA